MFADDNTPTASRRHFLMLLAAGSAATIGGLAVAAPSPAPTAPTTAAPADSTSADPPPSDDARALAGLVRRRYGQHLTEAQLTAVTEELDQRLQTGTRLRGVKLANGDEPSTIFRA